MISRETEIILKSTHIGEAESWTFEKVKIWVKERLKLSSRVSTKGDEGRSVRDMDTEGEDKFKIVRIVTENETIYVYAYIARQILQHFNDG